MVGNFDVPRRWLRRTSRKLHTCTASSLVARVVARFSNILDDLTAVKGKKITVTSPDEVLSTQSERLLP